MGILALANATYTLGFSLLVASFSYLVAFVVQTKTHNAILASSIIACSLYSLMIYLVYAGGVANTGPLWVFIVAPVSMFIQGLKRGLIGLSIFSLIIVLIMFVPGEFFSNESYEPEFKLRFILSFLTVIFLSACYEYSREKSQNHTLQLSKQYEQLALTDQLTQLANRRGAFNKIEIEQARMARSKEPLSLILCDVDHFKKINDDYGHLTGDAVLIKLAERFKSLVRGQDMVARWGGEEFLFILPGTSVENAALVAQKIHDALAQEKIVHQGRELTITVSMGVVEMQVGGTVDTAINCADKYLYQAKNSGRNQTFPKLL
ncbi:GGDEF domain-containing protein [Maricurvus nonylphenolicus]